MNTIMNNVLSFLLKPSVIDNFVANFLWWLVLLIVSTVYLNATNRLYPLLYKFFGQKIVGYIRYLITFIMHPLVRISLLAYLLININIQQGDLFLSVLVFLIALSFLWQPQKKLLFNPVPQFMDDFNDQDTLSKNWEIKTGNPQIESNFGKPQPDLLLKYVGNQATNSLVILKKIKIQRGIIECDFYLEPGSLFNIVFLCSIQSHNWYMARYESRGQNSDGILLKDQGPGNNWGELVMSGTRTTPKEWHRARVEFDKEKITMYRDGVLIADAKQPRVLGEEIGIFNECADVHVDNLSFIEK